MLFSVMKAITAIPDESLRDSSLLRCLLFWFGDHGYAFGFDHTSTIKADEMLFMLSAHDSLGVFDLFIECVSVLKNI